MKNWTVSTNCRKFWTSKPVNPWCFRLQFASLRLNNRMKCCCIPRSVSWIFVFWCKQWVIFICGVRPWNSSDHCQLCIRSSSFYTNQGFSALQLNMKLFYPKVDSSSWFMICDLKGEIWVLTRQNLAVAVIEISTKSCRYFFSNNLRVCHAEINNNFADFS